MKITSNKRLRNSLFILLLFAFSCGKKQGAAPDFPILAWYGPENPRSNLNAFLQLRAAGFTLSYSGGSDREHNLADLDLAKGADLKLLLADSRIEAFLTGLDSTFEQVDNVVRDYSRHPAFWGYYLQDEPKANDFERLAVLKNHLAEKDPNHPAYINILPTYAAQAKRATFTYREYIDRYMQIVQPSLLSFEHYPIIEYGMRDDYYENLEIIRSNAANRRIPFWAMALSVAYDPYPKPEHSHLRMQLYSSLAYGAKGLQYFSFNVPKSREFRFGQALLDSTGKATPLYKDATQINQEIRRLGTTLSQLTSTGVYHNDPVPTGCAPLNQRLPIAKIEGGPFLAGFFVDSKRQKYVLLANKNYNFGAEPRITFADNVRKIIEIPKNSTPPFAVSWLEDDSERSCLILFKAGDGRLFRIVQ